jgi:hypothetical protein
MSARRSTYSLEQVQSLVARREYRISSTAMAGAAELYLDEQDIVACVLSLGARDFYKTMPSEKRRGSFQDVYKTRYHGFAIYLKVQVVGEQRVAVISFKRDQSL